MNLKDLGWDDFYNSLELDLNSIARITEVHRSHLRAAKERKFINVHVSGGTDLQPVVGDWVKTTPEFEDEQGEVAAVLAEVLPRRSVFSRWSNEGEQAIAANVDRVFIVTSANQDFNINRLHRFLLLVKKGGAEPVVILSKTDLLENPGELLTEAAEKLQVKVMGTSLVNDQGIEEVSQLLPVGSSSVFVGSSGVGKSSLVNRLLGEEVQLTKDIRGDDGKGRHTTTSRQMFAIPDKGLIIDTPGVREVQVFGELDDVLETFPKVAALIGRCKFSDCRHESEPGCAIRKALESGDLDDKEWQSYLKLQKEVEFAKRKNNKAEMSNSKKRWKQINKMIKNKKKLDNRG